ncbi:MULTISPECIES: dTDP-4-dehydrorhamnose reductase [unclassified Neptuniibacter]|uniref:dTDP-4-dehydrorhamnose reductase n=1 Tax=unclassified Neptuniibacter TaxID=2630693 RepID=UPI0025FFA819|nr:MULTISPECIES: dTDP-4-dehydrorhamnose reductase [unclassified Neptuniibacter]|tara:strand:- start:4394 stop:5308 length:915 start_codon:yes stop_codon:yes gene_type:complete
MDLELLLKPMKLLVTGAQGQVGTALTRLAETEPFFEICALDKSQLDITDEQQIKEQLALHLPDYVVNCAAFDHIDEAEHKAELCYDVNALGVEKLALACGDLSIPMFHLSTDYVFDGHYASGYTEDDDVAPLGIYGDSKWQGEEVLRRVLPKHLILRVSWLFSEQGNNFVLRTLESARHKNALEAVSDRRGCPTSASDVARVVLAMLKQVHNGAEVWGTYHYCGAEITNRYDFCKEILIAAGSYESFKVEKLVPISSKDYVTEAQRPNTSILTCKKLLSVFGIRQRPWRQELQWLMRVIYDSPR